MIDLGKEIAHDLRKLSDHSYLRESGYFLNQLNMFTSRMGILGRIVWQSHIIEEDINGRPW